MSLFVSGGATDIANRPQDGRGVYNAMSAALKDAKQNPENVSYVNAHASSSIIGMC